MPRDRAATTAHESVYRTLRSDIAEGRLPPGTRLVQRQIASRMGTSPIPVIDALRRLEGEGLLVTTPGVGTRVKAWSPQEVEEVYLIRAALEGVACRLFASRAAVEDLSLLDYYHREFDAAAAAGSLDACATADERLHFHIARAARSLELFRLIENSACVLLTLSRTMLPRTLEEALPVGPVGIHEQLVAVLRSRDPDLAERVGREHVLESLARFKPLLLGSSSPGQP